MISTAPKQTAAQSECTSSLKGKRAAVILYSVYLLDPRPRRAAEAMIEAGMEVDVLCISAGSDEPVSEIANEVRIFRRPMSQERGSKWTYLWQYGRFFLASFWFLTCRGYRRNYDVVHVHNMPDLLVFSALIAKLRGAKILLDLHDPMPELMMNIYGLSVSSWSVRLLRVLERWSIRFADIAYTPNITFKNVFTSRSCRPEKMHIVMNSPLPETFNPDLAPESPRRDGIFRIMHHGTILHRHGIDILVEAVHRLRARIPGIQLDIYGLHTPTADLILDLVRQFNLGDAVHYRGSKSQEEIAQAIRESDLGVIPNRRSVFTELNFPTRIFEFLAMNRPVIVPTTQGIKDYFTPEQIVMFEPGNVDDLTAKILWVYENPRAATDILQRGREVYAANRWSGEKSRFLKSVASLLK